MSCGRGIVWHAAFYNGGCLAYNVTSNSTSKQLYVGVDEIYADPDPVALPGSLCTDSCQKVVSLPFVLPSSL